MAHASRTLILVLLLAGLISPASFFAENKYHISLTDYVVSLAKYLASLQTGTFDCWLYHVCSNPPGSSELLQQIQFGLGRNSIPALSVDGRFNWSLVMHRTKDPSLIVIHVDYTSRNTTMWSNYGRFLGSISSESRILLLVKTVPEALKLSIYINSFSNSKMFNVLFLSTDRKETVVVDFKQKSFTKYEAFFNPKIVFPDQSRNLYGKPLRYSLVKGISNACYGSECVGYDVTLVKEISKFLNTSAKYVKFVCPYEINEERDYLFDCVRDVAYGPDCFFDIFVEPSSGAEYDRAFLELSKPFENVFLAPSGRLLNIVELFLRPFQTELWVVIFIGMVVVKLASLLVPNGLKNDPLLLPICGFERFGLNRASLKEKLVMTALILIFFFISNVYETKIISLMSDKPRVRIIQTLQDVLDTGTKVKADWHLAQEFPMFNSLYSYVNYSHEPEERLDGTSVYMANGFVGSLLVQRAINWDFASNQPRYRIMDERFAMGVAFYSVPAKSALKHHFRFVEKALFEGGILNYWWELFTKERKRSSIFSDGVNSSAGILFFSDLIPLWYIIPFGTTISLFVFAIEISYTSFVRIY